MAHHDIHVHYFSPLSKERKDGTAGYDEWLVAVFHPRKKKLYLQAMSVPCDDDSVRH